VCVSIGKAEECEFVVPCISVFDSININMQFGVFGFNAEDVNTLCKSVLYLNALYGSILHHFRVVSLNISLTSHLSSLNIISDLEYVY